MLKWVLDAGQSVRFAARFANSTAASDPSAGETRRLSAVAPGAGRGLRRPVTTLVPSLQYSARSRPNRNGPVLR